MPDPDEPRLSSAEIGKDAVQSTVEAAASTVGEVAVILTNAVRDIARAVGGLATEVFEIQESSRRAGEAGRADRAGTDDGTDNGTDDGTD